MLKFLRELRIYNKEIFYLPKNSFLILKKVLGLLWLSDSNHRYKLILSGVFVLFTIVFSVFVPLFFKYIIDSFISLDNSIVFTLTIVFIYGIAWTITNVMMSIREILAIPILERTIRNLNLMVFDHLNELPYSVRVNKKTGALTSSMERIQIALPNIFWGLFFHTLPTIVEILLSSLILFILYNYIYALLLIFTFIFFIFFSIIGTNLSAIYQKNSFQKNLKVNGVLVDELINFDSVRLFGNYQLSRNNFNKVLIMRELSENKNLLFLECVRQVQNIIMGISFIILTLMTAFFVFKSHLKISDFILVNTYILQFFTPLSVFGMIFRNLRRSFTDINSIFSLLEEKGSSKLNLKIQTQELKVKQGHIVFQDVTFGYEKGNPILHHLNLEILPGRITAIIGKSGIGKSSLIKLLLNFYDTWSGNIFIDGQNIKDVNTFSLVNAIGVIPQETAIFNKSLLYNIKYGNNEANFEDIKRAIKFADLDHLVYSRNILNDYESMVGERGSKLSGGEKQRIGIARLFLKNPNIYILDEPTSALDKKSEKYIISKMLDLARGKTTIIITHSTHTMTQADEIIDLNMYRKRN